MKAGPSFFSGQLGFRYSKKNIGNWRINTGDFINSILRVPGDIV